MDSAEALWIVSPMHDSSRARLSLLSEAMSQGRLIEIFADRARFSRRPQLFSDDFAPSNLQI